MCGVCGIFSYAADGASVAVEPRVLARMRDTLTHRGPDDQGLYISPDRRVGLGHRRLSIIDLTSAAKQPMTNEDGTIWLVYNGEIYNYRELTRELARKGHRFRTRSDTEVIIHLYEESGIHCVERLDGMFAFALWDSSKQELLLVRDRLGIKPLYYATGNGVLAFASEPKAILEHPLFGRDPDLAAISLYLTFNAVPAPATLFRDIRKLRPGTLLNISSRGVRNVTYWEIPAGMAGAASQEVCIERIRELFRAATRKRMMSDVPFGAFLSGGIDSTMNVACMTEVLVEPVKTFTIGFGGNGVDVPNELDMAQLAATSYQTCHSELIVTPRDILESFPKFIHHMDDPIGTPTPISNFHAARLVHTSGVTVAQVGEGSDEIFVGYPQVYANLRTGPFWARYRRLPVPLKRSAFAFGKSILTRLDNPDMSGRTDSPVLELLRRASEGAEPYWGFGNCFSEIDKHSLLTEAFWENADPSEPAKLVGHHYREFERRHPEADYLQRVTYLDLQISLAERLLMRVDKTTMAWGVEARVPFLDHSLVEFVLTIPTRMKVGGGPKSIFKKTCEGMVPQEIIRRRKMGFPTPAAVYLGPEVREFVEDRIFQSFIVSSGLFSPEYIRKVLRIYDRGRRNYFFLIWNLFTLAYWYDYWVEKSRG